MKVIHHTVRYLPPSQTFIADLINQLEPLVAEQHIFAHEVLANQKTIIDDISHRSSNFLIKKSLNFINQKRGFCHNTNYSYAKKLLLQYQPDIIHCHFGTAAYFNYYLQKYAHTNIPMVISLHGFDVFFCDSLFNQYKETIKLIANKNVIFTCPSIFLKQKVIKSLSIPNEKIIVVPNGFNSKLFKYTPPKKIIDQRAFKIAHVGRFIDVKEQKYLLEAIHLLKKQGMTQITLDLIGDGELQQECIMLAKTLGIEKQVTFHGAIAHKTVASIIQDSDIYAHPSFTLPTGQAESFGIAILEAIATGKPVIITDSGGMSEILHQKNERFVKIVKQKSAQAIADSIQVFISSWSSINWQEFQRYRDKIINKNNINQTALLITQLYKSLLDGSV
ncbi:hypothetical protein CMT41_15480 [Colwellia sp. MT41]|uniref:glycosyltransferase family 4 protein n=1 Tax=Colwellia sp. MT41 TaxID=58049 RepID=UPI000717599B|nr:glycosyltransferase family 4 protein [Colwellia sp. MT41]ALO35968.1 hypothetical protein CMT41_15480 [Colwellia sp. MT41]